ncbi:MAG: hypothetical protein ABL864_05630 [Terricaulis sp.]
MSYFFPITAELVAPLENRKRPLGHSGYAATDRTRANAKRSHVANVASPSVSQSDWRDYFEERAAIREHDGGLSRADAEAGALADCVARWRALNPLPASGDDACAHCGGAAPCTPVLAPGGHAWLHRECVYPMNRALDAAARAAVLAALESP